jgi:NlpC/P60 family/Bacterial dipeptidyl-peptidase Sh3 domain
LEERGGWAWGYCEHDHYVGYLAAADLGAPLTPSHVVAAREAPVFSTSSIKSPVRLTLTLGARLMGEFRGDFLETDLGWIHVRHVAATGRMMDEPAAIAERLSGSPYLWGGRGAGGVDCSGLIQLALELSGNRCPRDSDQQLSELGSEIAQDAPLIRGDLVFFPGHVGIMADERALIHANAHWMAAVTEPLDDVIARLRDHFDQPVLARRRLAS